MLGATQPKFRRIRNLKLRIAADRNLEASAKSNRAPVSKQYSSITEPIRTLRGHTDSVLSVIFSPDGQTIASGSMDKTIKLWKRDGTLLKTLNNDDVVAQVSFSPDGRTIAVGNGDRIIKLWKQDGTLIKVLKSVDRLWSLSFSPDGQTIASSANCSIKLWERDGTLIKTLEGHTAPVHSVNFSPDGQTIASGSSDKTIKLWKIN